MGFDNCLEIKLIKLYSYKICMRLEVICWQSPEVDKPLQVEPVEAGMHLIL